MFSFYQLIYLIIDLTHSIHKSKLRYDYKKELTVYELFNILYQYARIKYLVNY